MNITRRVAMLSLLSLSHRTFMPKDVNFSYSFHTIETGEQTVKASVVRGNIPVAPEPIYVELDVTGFTLPDLGHPDLDPKITEVFYETTWTKDGLPIAGQYANPQSISINDKSYIRGPKFMWVFDEPGTYVGTVTAINMHDHSEVATHVMDPIVVQDYVDYFTADPDRRIIVWSADGDTDTTGLDPAILAHPNTFFTDDISTLGAIRYRSPNEHMCFLMRNGDETTDKLLVRSENTPNFYMRGYTGSNGTARHKLNHQGLPLQFAEGLPNVSVQVTGIEITNDLDVMDADLLSTEAYGKGLVIGGTSFTSLMVFSDCHFTKCAIAMQPEANAAGYVAMHDCLFEGNATCDILGKFGAWTQLIGTKTTRFTEQPHAYDGVDGGWSVRLKDNLNIWMTEINGWGAHGYDGRRAKDVTQPALRIGDSWTGTVGKPIYVGASTINGAVGLENRSAFNASKPEMVVIEGSRLNMNTERTNGNTLINLSTVGSKFYNNIMGAAAALDHRYPDATSYSNLHHGIIHADDNKNETASGSPTVDGYRYGDGVMDGMVTAQFNTMMNLDQASRWDAGIFIGLRDSDFRNVVDQNNQLYAPYQLDLPQTAESVDRSQHGSLTYVVNPYWSHDFTPVPASGISDQMVTVSGITGGFTSGATLTQGGVSAEVWTIQLDSIADETRIWLGPQTGGTFVAGAITDDVSGSGTVVGNQEYGGTMIDGTPDTPVSAVNKTWVPPVDHYGNPRSFGTAIKGAVEKL